MSDKIVDKALQERIVNELEDRINKSNALQFMINTEGWGILIETFNDMKDNQLKELSKQRPGDDKHVLAAHSVWFSVVNTIDNIVNAVDSAILDGENAKVELQSLTQRDWFEDFEQ